MRKSLLIILAFLPLVSLVCFHTVRLWENRAWSKEVHGLVAPGPGWKYK